MPQLLTTVFLNVCQQQKNTPKLPMILSDLTHNQNPQQTVVAGAGDAVVDDDVSIDAFIMTIDSLNSTKQMG